MRYRNGSNRELEFTLRGHVHNVAPGHTCEIPVELEYALASRGLPLQRDPAEDEREEVPEMPLAWKSGALPPPGSNARVWLTRAIEANAEAQRERERAEAAEEHADVAEHHIDELRADFERVCRQRDEALALVEAAGAAKAEEERQRARADAAERRATELLAELATARRERDEALKHAAAGAAGSPGKPDDAPPSEAPADGAARAGDDPKLPHTPEIDGSGGSSRKHRK